MSAFIQFKDVKKTYKVGDIEIHASNGVNFEVNKGEFVVIVGPSGAGKTTILNLLGGMDQPTSGSIMLMVKMLRVMMKQNLRNIEEMILVLCFNFIILCKT